MRSSDSDAWQTPQELFNELNEEFHFDIDLCANKENSKCRDYCVDYLTNYWKCGLDNENTTRIDLKESMGRGQFITSAFMNPPYSNPKPFIEKAWEDSKYCKIVCLVKCDPSTKWWATFWNYNIIYDNIECKERFNSPKLGCEIRFLPKRIKFDHPDFCTKHGPGGYKGDIKWCFACEKPCKTGGNFSSALIIMDRRGL